jgi:hypothetical protein
MALAMGGARKLKIRPAAMGGKHAGRLKLLFQAAFVFAADRLEAIAFADRSGVQGAHRVIATGLLDDGV